MDRKKQTYVKTLPCPKLCLPVVSMYLLDISATQLSSQFSTRAAKAGKGNVLVCLPARQEQQNVVRYKSLVHLYLPFGHPDFYIGGHIWMQLLINSVNKNALH